MMKYLHRQLLLLLFPSLLIAEVFLPGMQAQEAGIEFAKVQQCQLCHANTKNGAADPYLSWQSGLMSQAARDPVYLAALAIANQDVAGVGEYCIRCHAPRGWLEGRSTPADATALIREDRHGISCDFCHSLIDPISAEAKDLIEHIPPGYGNGMFVADPANVVRGPYDDARGAMPHHTKKSDYHASSQLCGPCHNVSNPLQADDVNMQPPYAYGHIERTYSEWALSDFAKMGREGSCQSCHYPKVSEGGQASRYGSPHRDYFVQHGPVGGSTWVQDAIWHLNNEDKDVSREALDLGIARTKAFLKTAARLDLTRSSPEKIKVRITNLTGHKLPTGYPEGRRMWINIQCLNKELKLIKEIGRYGQTEGQLAGKAVAVPTLLDPQATRVYESLPALSEQQAKKYNKSPGPSFHFVLNDTIVKDNRIPPKGFNNAAFAEHHSEPVGAEYGDGQHWDDFELSLPAKCDEVKVRLLYQSVSWEYIKFLVETNTTNDLGKQLYDAWRQTGHCEPQIMAEASIQVSQ